MTIYDGVMALIVVYCVFQGYWRGMAWQVAPIASLVLGYVVGMPLSIVTAPWFGQPPLNQLFALVTMYLLVSLGVYLLVRSVRDSIDRLKLTEFDRHLGAVLGGVKGVLFTVALTLGLITVSPMLRNMILKSESSTIAARILNRVSPILPAAAKDMLEPYLKRVREHLPSIAETPVETPTTNTRTTSTGGSRTSAPLPGDRDFGTGDFGPHDFGPGDFGAAPNPDSGVTPPDAPASGEPVRSRRRRRPVQRIEDAPLPVAQDAEQSANDWNFAEPYAPTQPPVRKNPRPAPTAPRTADPSADPTFDQFGNDPK